MRAFFLFLIFLLTSCVNTSEELAHLPLSSLLAKYGSLPEFYNKERRIFSVEQIERYILEEDEIIRKVNLENENIAMLPDDVESMGDDQIVEMKKYHIRIFPDKISWNEILVLHGDIDGIQPFGGHNPGFHVIKNGVIVDEMLSRNGWGH
jgi:hypothetical protein